ncbi:MAG: hypothetical protein BV459_07605, partial [Thermoplasmata archaeon M11B2D]
MKFYTNVKTYGNSILVREVENGTKRQYRIKDFSPSLYLLSNKQTTPDAVTLDGRPLSVVNPGKISDCKEFLERYSDVSNFEIFGNTNWTYQFIANEYPQTPIEYDSSLVTVCNIDIEVDSRNGFPKPEYASDKITAVCMRIGKTSYLFGCGDFVVPENRTHDVVYTKCNNEPHLLRQVLARWCDKHPDIVTGWNVEGFDIPYLVNRMTKIIGEDETKTLSPWNLLSTKDTFVNGRESVVHSIGGVAVLDYYNLYKKFRLVPRESYKLDFIAKEELGESKLEYDGPLWQLCDNDFQTFMEYNLRDVDLVDRLDAKLKMIDLAMVLAYQSKCNYEDVFFQVRMWDCLIYNHLLARGIAVPQKDKLVVSSSYDGAYVKDPVCGMHEWAVSFDLDSLYPHLVIQYNISPEKFVPVEYVPEEVKEHIDIGAISVDYILSEEHDFSILKKHQLTMTPNGQFFKTDSQGFLGEIMETMYAERKRYKSMAKESKKKLESIDKDTRAHDEETKRMERYSLLERGLKTTLNSGYGALGNQYFRFYDHRQAAAITSSGQLSIRWIEKRFNELFNKVLGTNNVDYVIYIDTDSNYITVKDFVEKKFGDDASVSILEKVNFINALCEKKLIPHIDKSYTELAEYVCAYSQAMRMKREVIANRGIWTGKKRYVLSVCDEEGIRYDTPELKITGLETKRSSVPEPCRTALQKSYEIALNGTESDMIEFVVGFRKEFEELPIESIAFPRGVSDIEKYQEANFSFRKGTPIHVRAAILHNKQIDKLNLGNEMQPIRSGDKLKFVYLKMPNPLG